MNKLYVFAIGGSGERVMNSLIMLLSAGVDVGASTIQPVIIDNDVKSKALADCLNLIEYYNAAPAHDNTKIGINTLYQLSGMNNNLLPSFFKTKVEQPIILNKSGELIKNLDTVIGNIPDGVNDDIKEEKNLLFTKDDLDMPLSVGYVGRPNIGSVVLNSEALATEGFRTIINNLSNADGVVVVGSLFGGTGAAGFPLLVNTINTLRNENRPLLGGVAVLPYFDTSKQQNIDQPIDIRKYDVDSGSFDVKTRAALMYYDAHMNDMDYRYYVGDGSHKDMYEHCVGGSNQNNRANRVELFAALSVIDFSKQDTVRPGSCVYKRPVWRFDDKGISLLEDIVDGNVRKSLAKFQMLKTLLESDKVGSIKWAIKEKSPYVHNINITENDVNAMCNGAGNIPQVYGIYNLFKAWSEWWNMLGAEGANRKIRLIDETSARNVNIEDLPTKFYSKGNFGVAKTEERGFFNRRTCPVKFKVNDKLIAAYNENAQSYSQSAANANSKYVVLLKIISDALEKEISDSTNL